MRRFTILTTFFAATALMTPVAMRADDHHEKERRYYDREGRDYHAWNNQEDRAYRVYLTEQHRSYREFRKVRPVDQGAYFRWRHSHPDNVLFKLEIR
jgi:hypothetical protein